MCVDRYADNILLNNEIILIWILTVLHFVKLLWSVGDKIPKSTTCSMEFYDNRTVDVFWLLENLGELEVRCLKPLSLHFSITLPVQYLFRSVVHRLHSSYFVMTHICDERPMRNNDSIALDKLLFHLTVPLTPVIYNNHLICDTVSLVHIFCSLLTDNQVPQALISSSF